MIFRTHLNGQSKKTESVSSVTLPIRRKNGGKKESKVFRLSDGGIGKYKPSAKVTRIVKDYKERTFVSWERLKCSKLCKI